MNGTTPYFYISVLTNKILVNTANTDIASNYYRYSAGSNGSISDALKKTMCIGEIGTFASNTPNQVFPYFKISSQSTTNTFYSISCEITIIK